ncbi:solute carrier family 35 member G1-like [Ptychodera flava]|uniref:solute carrier family 35 member G1-like n=1 Tax=Ptychodera flava TaxID=63121 RepID=UPI003969F9D0
MESSIELTWLFKDDRGNQSNAQEGSSTCGTNCLARFRNQLGVTLALLLGPFSAVAALLTGLARAVPPVQQSFLSGVAVLIPVIAICAYQRPQVFYKDWKKMLPLVAQAIFASVATVAWFQAVKHTNLGSFTALSKAFVMLTSTIGGALLLGESCRIVDIVAVLTNISGVTLITRPPFLFGRNIQNEVHANETLSTTTPEDSLVGYAWTMTYGILISSAMLTVRALGESVPVTVKLLYSGVIAFIVCLIVMVCTEVPVWKMPSRDAWLTVGMCVFSTLQTYSVNGSAHLERVGVASLLGVLDVVFSFIFQALIVGKKPNRFDLIGAVLIIFGCVIVSVQTIWDNLKRDKDRANE